MTTIIALIPARYESVRFPGKVLADRTGKPLIQHVCERARESRLVQRVIVATDSPRIAATIRAFGGEAIMTSAEHLNGTSRIAEAARGLDADIIVNLQGDEPQLDPDLIDKTVQLLLDHPEAPMATLASPFAPDEDPSDPNIVKVVMDDRGFARSFTRRLDAIPPAAPGTTPLKHIGLYVYRAGFLQIYIALPPTPLEQAERLEQMRVIEHGYPIVVARGEVRHHGIDTPAQYDEFVRWHKAQTPVR